MSFERKEKNIAGLVGLGVVGVILLVALVFVLSCVGTYNSLVNAQIDVETAQAEVENQMQARAEKIPDLVKVVQASAKHEETIFIAVAEARQGLMNAIESGDPEKIGEADEKLTGAVNKVLALAENYPELKTSEQYTALMDSIEGAVNRIGVARGNYNTLVGKYNKKVRNFPGSILAGMFGFEPMKEYKATAENAHDASIVDIN